MREVLTEQWRSVWDFDGGLAGLISGEWRAAQRQLIVSASPYQNKHSDIRSTRRQTLDLHASALARRDVTPV
jgi:hypothetical protein